MDSKLTIWADTDDGYYYVISHAQVFSTKRVGQGLGIKASVDAIGHICHKLPQTLLKLEVTKKSLKIRPRVAYKHCY